VSSSREVDWPLQSANGRFRRKEDLLVRYYYVAHPILQNTPVSMFEVFFELYLSVLEVLRKRVVSTLEYTLSIVLIHYFTRFHLGHLASSICFASWSTRSTPVPFR
jgi:hypothetical protein